MSRMRSTSKNLSTAARLTAVCVCLIVAAGCDKDKESKSAKPAPVAAAAAKPAAADAPIIDMPMTNPNDVLAQVYDRKLLQKELDVEMERTLASSQGQSIPPGMLPQIKIKMRKDLIERFVAQTVLLHVADEQKITASAEERAALTKELEAKLPPGMTFDKVLASSGMNREEFEKQATDEIRIRKLIEKQTESLVPPTADEIKAFYTNSVSQFEMPERARVSHVLVKCEPGAKDADKQKMKQKAEGLRERLVKGEDFAEVAKANSDCPSSASGGDLGLLPRGQTVKPFEDAAFSQEINAIGPIVETEFGYHIIKVTERKQSGLVPLPEVEKEISSYLLKEKRQQVVMDYVAKLKSEANVQYGK